MKQKYKNWLLLQPWKLSEKVVCPECGNEAVDYRVIGDKSTNIGWGLIWCNSCHTGIHVSRMKLPENAKVISFEEAEKSKDIWPDYQIELINP